MKLIFSALALLMLGFRADAQIPVQSLGLLRDSFPQEKIYIQFDKDAYLAGETVWFKAYLLSDLLPSDLSANFFIEISDDKSKVIQQKKLPIVAGTVSGSLELPAELPQGNYAIRAFTPWMLNFDAAFIYRKQLFIYGAKGNATPVSQPNKEYRFDLFPEGGNLVAGVVNVVAFKATDQYGLPIEVKGKITDGTGNLIADIETVHDGMGLFGLLPANGQTYAAVISFPGNIEKTFNLPAIQEKGVSVQIREEDASKRRIIINAQGMVEPDERSLTVIGQMHQQLLFNQPMVLSGNNAYFSIDTRSFPTGILQVTVFNNKGQALAERMCFVRNDEFQMPVKINLDTVSLQGKGKNDYSFLLPDSVGGSFSAVVTDEILAITDSSKDNILSGLLLSADLKGYIHRPAYYFSANTKAVRSALDLVMLTNGWRKVSWKEIVQSQFPKIRYRDRNYIQISGTVYSSRTKLPVNGGEVNFLMRTRDSLTDFFQAEVNNKGSFFLENLVYMDTAQFGFQYNAKKNKEKELYVKLDSRNTEDAYEVPSTQFLFRPVQAITLVNSQRNYAISTDSSGMVQTLQEVTVTARKKTPVEILNQKYTSGLFTSMNMVKVIDLVNNDPGAGALNVFQYIQGRVPGVMVRTSGTPPTYTVYTRRAMSLTGGNIPVPLYLDEYLADASQIATIPMNQVAMIKYFPTGFMGNSSVGSTQALAIYTKKGEDAPGTNNTYLNAFSYPGYSVVREFYSPDYELNPELKKSPDRRTTIYWQPNLQADPLTGKYNIRFFNSDKARKLRVVIEGFTSDGKFIHEEKTVE